MNEELLQKLYQKYGLSAKGSFESFKADMEDPSVRRKVYDKYLAQKGTFEQFETDLGVSSPSAMDYVNATLGAFNRGAVQTLSAPLKLEGVLEETLGVRSPIQLATDALGITSPDSPLALQAANAIQGVTEEINPRYSNVNETLQQVGEGLGQGAGFIATAGIGGGTNALTQTATKVPTLLQATGQAATKIAKGAATPVGVTGGAITAVPEWEAAKAAGATDEEAFQTLLKNYLVGQTEAIPVGNLINRVNKLTGGGVVEAIKRIGKSMVTGGMEEAIQEAVQTYLTNEIARTDYDPKRDPLFQVLESAKVGGIVGAILPGAMGLASRISEDKRQSYVDKINDLKAEATVNQLEAEEAAEAKSAKIAEVESAIASLPVEPQIANIQDEIYNETVPSANAQTNEGGQTSQPNNQTQTQIDDTQNIQGLPSQIREGQESIQAKPIEETGSKETSPSGILQEGKIGTTKLQRQINQATGVKREASPIQSDEYILLKKQIRDFSRGFREGKKTGLKEGTEAYKTKIGEFGTLVSDFLSGTKRTGQKIQKGTDKAGKPIMVDEIIKTGGVELNERQQNAVVKRMTRVNLGNSRSVDSFLNYLGKTIQDSKYDQKVSDTEATISSIKSRIKQLPSTIQPEVTKFIQAPIEYVDINTHQELANKVSAFLSKPGTTKYKPLNLAELADYNERTRQEITTVRNQELAEELQTPIGDSEFTPEEIDRILSEEDVDPFEENADETRKQLITESLRSQAEYSKMGLPDNITGPESQILSSMKELDINSLSPKELKAYIKSVDNAIVNNDYSSGSGWIWARNEANKGAERVKNVKALDVVSELSGIGSIMTMPMYTKGIFGTTRRAGEVNANTGVADVLNGYTKTENRTQQLEDEYTEFVEKLDNLHGGDTRSKESTVRQAIAGYLVRYKSDPVLELAQKRKDLKESIDRTKTLDPETAAIAEKVLAEFDGAKTPDDVFASLKAKDIKSYKLLEFFINKYSEIVDELAFNTETFYNEPFVREYNYTPVSLKFIGEQELVDDRQRIFDPSAPVRPKRSTTTIEASGRIPINRALDMDFSYNMVAKYKESIYDIETARHKLKVREFYKNPVADKIFSVQTATGPQTNKQNFYKYYSHVEQDNRGASPFQKDFFTTVNKLTGIFRDISYSMLFADPFKYASQYFPGAANTVINLGPSFLTVSPSKAEGVLAQYPISKRGARLGGTDFGEKMYNATMFHVLGKKSKLDRVHDKLNKFKHKVTIAFIKGDVDLAKRAWTTAYIKYLQDRGVTIDWNTEASLQQDPVRKEAAAYAEQFVNENMGPNQAAQYAKALKMNGGFEGLAKNLILPLSSYSINMKTRMLENFKYLFKGDSQARSEAAKNQIGLLAEAGVYTTLTYFVIASIWAALRGQLSGLLGFETPEEEGTDDFRNKMTRTTLVSDLNPFIAGSLLTNGYLEGLNYLAFSLREDEEMTRKQWEKEVGEPFAVFNSDYFGIYNSIFRTAEAPVQYSLNVDGNQLRTDNAVYEMTPDQRDFIAFNAWVQMFQTLGLGYGPLSKMLDGIRKDQIKIIKSGESSTSSPVFIPPVQPVQPIQPPVPNVPLPPIR